MKRFIMAILLAAAVMGCTNPIASLAKDTCAELDGAIVLQVGPILRKAISRAEDLGASGPELGAAMREECPETMSAIDNIGQEQEDREALPSKMVVDVTSCSDDGAGGTVRNGSTVTVDIFIGVQFLDAAGVVIDDGID